MSLEMKSLATSARQSATQLRSASGRLGRHDGGLPDACVSPNEHQRSQEIRYCRSPDGVQIAYAISGTGPTNSSRGALDVASAIRMGKPSWRHWIDSLSRGNTLIRYDERGNGLSDWNANDLSFAAMVSDLESVADASGLSEFPLLGVSQSCAVAVAYVVRHPERSISPGPLWWICKGLAKARRPPRD